MNPETPLLTWYKPAELELRLPADVTPPETWATQRPDTGLLLTLTAEGLQLEDLDQPKLKPLRLDFTQGEMAHRRRFGGGRGQAVAKACGLKAGVTPSIVDATAGLGRDSFVLASLGCPVLSLERSPVVHALLADALARAHADAELASILQHWQLRHLNASCELSRAVDEWSYSPEVVYLDPMFPHRDGAQNRAKAAAAVKKEMRLFRQLVGDDDDAPTLLAAALEVATHRVVVKRPRKAPPIDGPTPGLVLEGQSSRFDVYPKQALRRS